MNNIFCHVAGLTDETKIRLTNFLNKYDWKIINLDDVTKEIIAHDTLNSLYDDFKQLKKNNDKEYKEIEKKMNKYWKSKFIEIVNLHCTSNTINILIGTSNHFKNIRQYVNINTKLKFFIEVNNNENAKNIIKKNLDNFKDDIINSTFPLQYLDAKYLVSDMSAALMAPFVSGNTNGYFLDKMVIEGKKTFLQTLVWPHATEAQHLKYSEAQYEWAVANEAQVWRYFMEREYLYSTDTSLEYRFLFPAPFSKFQLALDRESSPRIAQFIGLQMAKAYYKKHDKNLQKLLEVSSIDLLKEASYKPKK